MNLEKLLSGKFILTVFAGIVFLYCSCTNILEPVAIKEILLIVIISYFNRQKV